MGTQCPLHESYREGAKGKEVRKALPDGDSHDPEHGRTGHITMNSWQRSKCTGYSKRLIMSIDDMRLVYAHNTFADLFLLVQLICIIIPLCLRYLTRHNIRPPVVKVYLR